MIPSADSRATSDRSALAPRAESAAGRPSCEKGAPQPVASLPDTTRSRWLVSRSGGGARGSPPTDQLEYGRWSSGRQAASGGGRNAGSPNLSQNTFPGGSPRTNRAHGTATAFSGGTTGSGAHPEKAKVSSTPSDDSSGEMAEDHAPTPPQRLSLTYFSKLSATLHGSARLAPHGLSPLADPAYRPYPAVCT